MADQRKVFATHGTKVKSALQFLADASESTGDVNRHLALQNRVDQFQRGLGPQLVYEDVMAVLEALDDGLAASQGAPDEPEWQEAHSAVVDLADEMQPQALRPYHDVIYEALDVPIDSADTPEERAQATAIRDRIRARKLLTTGELKYLQEQLERGEDVYEGDPRRHQFQSARIRASIAADVARHADDPAPTGALQAINLHRRVIGQPPLDPTAAGWSAEDVELEARRIAALPNPGAYEKLKRSLMR